jgi:hypothetical protein
LSSAFVEGEVLLDPDQPQALTSWCLEVKVGVGNLQLPGEPGLEDRPAGVAHVVGLDLQPDSPGAPQELALVADISVEERDVEIVSQADEVSFWVRLHDRAAQDAAIELANVVAVLQRYED